MHAQTPQHLGQSPHRNRRLLQPAKHRRLGKSLGGHTPLTLDEARFSAQGLRLWAKEVTQTLTDLCYLVHSSSFFPSPNTELCWFHDVRWNCSLSSFLKLMCMGTRGGEPYAPEVLLGLLLYGYATGVVSSRKIERATYEAVPFRFIAGNLHPDHDTLASFRRTFLPELKELFVQILLLAQEAGVLKLGTISLDGTKIHADASKHNAVSYKRLLEVEAQLRSEVEELFTLSEQSEQPEVPDGLVVRDEITRREDRLARLAQAKAVLEVRAQERTAEEQADYEAKLAQRAERERTTGRRPGGRPPTPPVPGPRASDQYNFTDPESRIMKNPTDAGFE